MVESDESWCICISSVVGTMLGYRGMNEASNLSFCAFVRPNCLMMAALSELYLSPSMAFSTVNTISSAMSAGKQTLVIKNWYCYP